MTMSVTMFEQAAPMGLDLVGGFNGAGNRPNSGADGDGVLPAWVPPAARTYLAHVEGGLGIRALAREARVHPSTVLRRVRRMQMLRDDPLVDSALRRMMDGAPQPAASLGAASLPVAPDVTPFAGAPSAAQPAIEPEARPEARPEPTLPIMPPPLVPTLSGELALAAEALPVLRRLAEPGAVLAVARDMEKGILVRESPDAEPTRLAIVERRLAEAMALRDWIACHSPDARVRRYRITGPGRTKLRRLLDGQWSGGRRPGRGLAEASAEFRGAAELVVVEDARLRHMRSALAESPLCALARRRDGDGRPLLPRHLVAAGERLREDFEIAQELRLDPEDWDALLARLPDLKELPAASPGPGPEAALARIERALADLGPGLADVALRCCCLLEGLEQVEKRLGWSGRSGKVVLRIALERLGQHYRLDAPVIG